VRRAWALAALWGTLLGCALRPPQVGERGPTLEDPVAEQAYQEALERYTSHREVYSMFDTRLLAFATSETTTFRTARVKRRAQFQKLPVEEVSRLLAVEEREAAAFHDFTFGAHLNEKRFDDFDKRDTAWRVALVTEAGQIVPKTIERLGRSNLELRAYYPALDDFWTAYRFRFPKVGADGRPLWPAGTKQAVLRVSSILGNAEFPVMLE